jgi:hypothetical protein
VDEPLAAPAVVVAAPPLPVVVAAAPPIPLVVAPPWPVVEAPPEPVDPEVGEVPPHPAASKSAHGAAKRGDVGPRFIVPAYLKMGSPRWGNRVNSGSIAGGQRR